MRISELTENSARAVLKDAIREAYLLNQSLSCELVEGKAGDLMNGAAKGVRAINTIITKLTALLQDTRMVRHFDSHFDKLKTIISGKFPHLADAVAGYGEWAARNPTKQIFITNLLIVAATLDGGYTGFWVADSLLRAGVELLRGSKLSTVVGKTASTSNAGDLIRLAKPNVMKLAKKMTGK